MSNSERPDWASADDAARDLAFDGRQPVPGAEHRAQLDDWPAPIPFDEWVVPPFPIDVLPAPFECWASSLATATQTPPDLAGLMTLAAIAAAGANRYTVRLAPEWDEPLNIFTAVVLPPASRKSAVFSKVVGPLLAAEAELMEAAAAEIERAEVTLRIAKGRQKRAVKRAVEAPTGDDEASALEAEALEARRAVSGARVPCPPRLVVDDVTPERLTGIMAANSGRIALLSAEGAFFEILNGRYARNRSQGPNMERVLQAHSGDPINVERVGRPGERIERPALTMGLAIQPHVIQSLAGTAAFSERGFLARFLYALPQTGIGFRDCAAKSVPTEARDAYSNAIRWLFAQRVPKKPDELRLSGEAQAAFDRFAQRVEVSLRPEGDLSDIPYWAGKLAGAVGRLAAILAVADAASRREAPASIEPWAIEGAVRLGDYFIPHAKAAFGEMGIDRTLEGAQRVLGWIKRERLTIVTRHEIHQRHRSRFRKVKDLQPSIDVLVERSFIETRPVARTPGKEGRPPGPSYDVNPRIFR